MKQEKDEQIELLKNITYRLMQGITILLGATTAGIIAMYAFNLTWAKTIIELTIISGAIGSGTLTYKMKKKREENMIIRYGTPNGAKICHKCQRKNDKKNSHCYFCKVKFKEEQNVDTKT